MKLIHTKFNRWNASQCLACPVGTYASVTGSSYCKPCTNGSYCADPTLAPVACPKGRELLSLLFLFK